MSGSKNASSPSQASDRTAVPQAAASNSRPDGHQPISAMGRRVTFKVKAEDSEGVAGEGTHERVLVDLERFMQRRTSRPLESR